MGNLESTPKAQAFMMVYGLPESVKRVLRLNCGPGLCFMHSVAICLNTVKTILDDDTRHPLYWIEVQSELEQMTEEDYNKFVFNRKREAKIANRV